MDASGDGLRNRTAWAAAGDGVLFYDPDGRNAITEKRQYVFTEWDPTADSDIDALRSVFDTNGDGVLDASDAEFAKFKVLVTNADGSTTAKTLAELGVVSIDLTADATEITLPDGSKIIGQTSLTFADGTTATVADTMLRGSTDSNRVEQVESVTAAGDRKVVSTGYNADGSIRFVFSSVSAASGAWVENAYDDNGDGVVNRLQSITRATAANGDTTEIVSNKIGADAATAILTDETKTVRSADGASVTIYRDWTGGGWYSEREERTTLSSGDTRITISDLARDGSVIRSETKSLSQDGLTRSNAVDQDGDGAAETVTTTSIAVAASGARTETVQVTNGDGSLRSSQTETVSADGQTKTITIDLNGDGAAESVQNTDIVVNADGSTSSVMSTVNRDGSVRMSSTQTQSADALTKTSAVDRNGDGVVDTTTVDATTVGAGGAREQTVTTTAANGAVINKTKTLLGADKVSSETWIDHGLDGVFDATDLARKTTVNAATQERTSTAYVRNPDGSINATTVTVSSADGLSMTSTSDLDGDGDIDATQTDVTTAAGITFTGSFAQTIGLSDYDVAGFANGATQSVRTVNQDGSLDASTTIITGADGLRSLTQSDVDGDGVADENTLDIRTLYTDGSTTRQTATYAADFSATIGGAPTLLNKTLVEQSADRLNTTTTVDNNGDGVVNMVSATVVNVDGSVTTTDRTYFASDHAAGRYASQTVTEVSANGLRSTVATDANGDGTVDTKVIEKAVLQANGALLTAVFTRNGDSSLRSHVLSRVSDDGLWRRTATDSDGDRFAERWRTSLTQLNSDGGTTTTEVLWGPEGYDIAGSSFELFTDWAQALAAANGGGAAQAMLTSRKLSETTTTTSDDGLKVVARADADGDGSVDLTTTTETVLTVDGGSATTTSVFDNIDNALRNASTVTVSGDGRLEVTSTDANGDGIVDLRSATSVLDTGVTSRVTEQIDRTGALQSRSQTVVSANGLVTTEYFDADGDGVYELTTEDTKSLLADGGETSRVVSKTGGTLHSQAVTTVSHDGLHVETKSDLDGDGGFDQRVVSQTTLLDDGSTRVATSDYVESGAQIASSETLTSSDGTRIDQTSDFDGNGLNDIENVTEILHDGTVKSISVYYESLKDAHLNLSTIENYKSRDGLIEVMVIDERSNGSVEFKSIDKTTLNADGSTQQIVEYYDSAAASFASNSISSGNTLASGGNLLSKKRIDTSDDGVTTEFYVDRDGVGGYDDLTVSNTEFLSDGYVKNSIITQNVSTSARKSAVVTKTSGDGLSSRVLTDVDGDGDFDIRTYEDVSGNGAVSLTTSQVSLSDINNLVRWERATVSADGRTETYKLDVDGDGALDQEGSTVVDLDQVTTSVVSDLSSSGAVERSVRSIQSANGHETETAFDIDGDGADEITRSVSISYSQVGEEITEYVESFGSSVGYREVSETAAHGMSSKTNIDADGDGVFDGAVEVIKSVDVTTGDFLTKTRAYYANGDLRYSEIAREFADGQSETWRSDHDGDGAVDRSVRIVNYLDGSLRKVISVFDENEILENRTVEYTTADGLSKTVMLDYDRNTDTSSVTHEYTFSAIGDGSYEWQNGVGSGYSTDVGYLNGNIAVKHVVDGTGVETWSMTRVITSNTGSVTSGKTTETFEVKLDSAGKARLLAEAARIYDTVFDRDMHDGEIEVLVEHTHDGQLNKISLIASLIEASEFNDRYGILSDAEFLTQIYYNALGRAPSLDELYANLTSLSSGEQSRFEIASEVSESVEHITVGNGHRKTNNFDVVHNPAEFERLLDRSYVEGIVKSIIDVVADRDALQAELDYYAERIMEGTDNFDDVVISMREVSIPTSAAFEKSVFGLSRGSLVIQAFQNALGRSPTVDEHARWLEAIRTDLITEDQFIFSLAQSPDHLAVGHDHLAPFAALSAFIVGSGSHAEALEGTAGDDVLLGGEGSDTLRGLAGDDVLSGRSGADYLDGGVGSDLVDYLNSGSGVQIYLSRQGNATLPAASGGDASGDTLLNIEHVAGSQFNDALDGDNGVNNKLWGRSGNDVMKGGTGVDTLYGGDGNDTLYGHWAGSRTETTGNALYGENGQDTLYGAAGADTLDGGTNSDWLFGHGGDDLIYGGGGDDLLLGQGGADDLRGGSGDDMLVGDAGADRLDGGSGIDTVRYWNSGSAVTVRLDGGVSSGGNAEGDVITNVENVIGSNYNDTLYGGAGANQIDGHNGNDRIYGSAGADVINGGAGSDIADYAYSSAAVSINLLAKDAQGYVLGAGGLAAGDKLLSIEILGGGSGNDVLAGDEQANYLWGRGGADNLNGRDGNDRLHGGDGNDTLSGEAGNDHLEGLAGADFVIGGIGADYLSGGDQNDTLSGGDGDDTLYGGNHNDILTGLAGADWLYGDAGDDVLTGGAGADYLDGGAGNDRVDYLNSGSGVQIYLSRQGNATLPAASGGDASGDTLLNIEHVAGSQFNDALDGDNGVNNKLWGRSGNDVMKGGTGVDTLYGGHGNDRLYGHWAGSRTETTGNALYGENGNDSLYGAAGADTLDGGSGNDWLVGGNGDDLIYGGSGNDELFGEGGVNTLYGGSGNDTIEGGGQGDRIDGGSGADTVRYWNSGAAVLVRLDGGVNSGGSAEGDVITNVENVIGSNYNDTLYGGAGANQIDGHNGNDRIYGSAGADVINGGAGSDIADYAYSSAAVSINLLAKDAQGYVLGAGGLAAGDKLLSIEILGGGSGNDVLAGDEQANQLRGKGGADNLNGRGGNDYLHGGDGNDTLSGEAGNDRLFGSSGADFMIGGIGADYLSGGDQNDTLSGGDGDDTLYGGNHNDILIGLAGADWLYGDAGDDVLTGGAGADYLDGGAGNDRVDYLNSGSAVQIYLSRQGSATLPAASGGDASGDTLLNIEHVAGSQFNDALDGDNGVNNKLWGRSGNDVMKGGTGVDTLYGGDGNDGLYGEWYGSRTETTGNALYGENGNDSLYGAAGADTLDGGANNDWLVGGNGNDLIYGGSGNDELFGEGGVNTLYGGSGNDTIEGGGQGDRIDGGSGADTVRYWNSGAAVLVRLDGGVNSGGNAAGDVITNVENVIGSNYNDTLYGGAGANQIDGHNGNDRIYGSAGADVINGGAGSDIADYAYSSAAVSINLLAKDAQGYVLGAGGLAAGDKLLNIEILGGGSGNDVLAGDEQANQLRGQGGADNLNGRGGNDYLHGGVGNDTLSGEAGNDRLFGSSGADFMIGGIGADYLSGGDQNDTLSGGDGDDTLYGGNHNDILTGLAGADWLYGDAGDDVLSGGAGADYLDGGAGNDRVDYLNSGSGVQIYLSRQGNATLPAASGGDASGDTLLNIEHVAGSQFNDALDGDNGVNNKLWGRSGNDVMKGGTGVDTLYGGDGNDRLYGHWAGSRTETTGNALYGENGNDSLYGAAGADTLDGGANNDWLVGGNGNDLIYGGSGNDELFGEGGVNTLYGGSGNDTIEGGGQGDRIDGGSGADTVRYWNSGSAVIVRLDGTVSSGGHAQGDVITNVENVIGSNYGDELFGTSASNQLDGHNGNDRLFGSVGSDVLNGGAGFDLVDYRHSSAGITINLLSKNSQGYVTPTGGAASGDSIINIEGIVGSHHADTIHADNARNIVNGFSGDDVIFGRSGNDDLYGDGGKDVISGDAGDDKIYGGDGNDILYGGAGADVIDGGGGYDFAMYDNSTAAVNVNLKDNTASGGYAAGDTLYFIERLVGSHYNDTLTGTHSRDWLYGRNGDDLIIAHSGNDYIDGQNGNDDLRGNYGDDLLNGGAGNDRLHGGNGNDVFRFVPGGQQRDIVHDFWKGDNQIDVSNFNVANLSQALSGSYQQGNHAMLVLTSGSNKTEVLVTNYLVSDFVASDFIF